MSQSTAAPNKAAEVGWLFVPQYYTLMNSDPSRLHCFYTKKSTMVHASENEDATPNVGQQDIHAKIESLGFENTKVYVSNVDSQSSADGGIVIQVLGEMSNKNGPWRRFVQTFFLAEQPNGYYVLNDIFRYLKDESEDVEPTEAEPVAVAEGAAPPADVPVPSVKEEVPSGVKEPVPTPAVKSEAPISSAIPSEDVSKAVEVAAAATDSTASAPAAAKGTKGHHAKTETSAPAKPAAPKTWANLAASGANRWGTAASASEASSSSPSSTAAATAAAAPAKSAATSGKGGKAGAASHGPHHGAATGHVFVKNVPVPQVSQDELRKALETQFGPMKECQLNTTKGFAFVEFTQPDAARRAVAASNEQGVKVGQATIVIEKRRPTAERGHHHGRGGSGRGSGRGGQHHQTHA
ncbi:ran protein binding protein [Malassezia pachydermatis]|uniref:Ran protein binding protein n=1 Tax=Malassezia pachydermatis TaxID=77020 RepID=A0A0M9VQT7_9BASI|nr:ran protein binding protein [Malassezia pachydermatis]KOS15889.1 ran protein binding protein [Malassezia pachydermatis]